MAVALTTTKNELNKVKDGLSKQIKSIGNNSTNKLDHLETLIASEYMAGSEVRNFVNDLVKKEKNTLNGKINLLQDRSQE